MILHATNPVNTGRLNEGSKTWQLANTGRAAITEVVTDLNLQDAPNR